MVRSQNKMSAVFKVLMLSFKFARIYARNSLQPKRTLCLDALMLGQESLFFDIDDNKMCVVFLQDYHIVGGVILKVVT